MGTTTSKTRGGAPSRPSHKQALMSGTGEDGRSSRSEDEDTLSTIKLRNLGGLFYAVMSTTSWFQPSCMRNVTAQYDVDFVNQELLIENSGTCCDVLQCFAHGIARPHGGQRMDQGPRDFDVSFCAWTNQKLASNCLVRQWCCMWGENCCMGRMFGCRAGKGTFQIMEVGYLHVDEANVPLRGESGMYHDDFYELQAAEFVPVQDETFDSDGPTFQQAPAPPPAPTYKKGSGQGQGQGQGQGAQISDPLDYGDSTADDQHQYDEPMFVDHSRPYDYILVGTEKRDQAWILVRNDQYSLSVGARKRFADILTGRYNYSDQIFLQLHYVQHTDPRAHTGKGRLICSCC